MPLFVIHGHDGPDALAKRPVVRPRHLEHLRPLSEAGKVVVAGRCSPTTARRRAAA
jgi:uncharacterized protein YciI